MTRKFQYIGLTVLICSVVFYISAPSNSSEQIISYELDKSSRTMTANITGKYRGNTNWTSVKDISLGKISTLRDGKDKMKIYKDRHIEENHQSESKSIATAVGTKVFSLDSLNRSTHVNSSELTTNKYLPNLQGDATSVSEKRHIAFLKVHKAASTTLQTMFFRFGFERNLSFVLPVKGHYFSLSTKTHQDIVPPRYGDHYDIICNHGCFSYKIYSEIMPKDSVYVAVVRNPYDQFVSAVHYYTEIYQFKYLMNVPGDRIENLIKHPEIYDKPLFYTMNSMARDFGFEDRHFFSESNKQARLYLKQLGNIFDFVLIAEYFDESLILMKRLLNWSLKDILYISKNVRGSSVEISDNLMKTFRARNKLDYLVYDFFYERFKGTLKQSEQSVLEETEHFKRVLNTVQHWCQDSNFGELAIDASKWNEKFVLNTKDCKLMTKKELSFIRMLKNETAG